MSRPYDYTSPESATAFFRKHPEQNSICVYDLCDGRVGISAWADWYPKTGHTVLGGYWQGLPDMVTEQAPTEEEVAAYADALRPWPDPARHFFSEEDLSQVFYPYVDDGKGGLRMLTKEEIEEHERKATEEPRP